MALRNNELLRIEAILDGDPPMTKEEAALISVLAGIQTSSSKYVLRVAVAAMTIAIERLHGDFDYIGKEAKDAAVAALDDDYQSSAEQREAWSESTRLTLLFREAQYRALFSPHFGAAWIVEATENTCAYEPTDVANCDVTKVEWTRKFPLVESRPVAPEMAPRFAHSYDNDIPF